MSKYSVKFSVEAGGCNYDDCISIEREIESDATPDEMRNIVKATLETAEEEVAWIFSTSIDEIQKIE